MVQLKLVTSIIFKIKEIRIKPLALSDLPVLLDFTDQWIGKSYYSEKDLEQIYRQSNLNGMNSSLIAWHNNKIKGIRFSLAPGQWIDSSSKIYSDRWGVAQNKAGYFKSLFICDEFQRMGLGSTLSHQSIEILKNMGAEAVVCHSWLESPNNSSQKYLKNNGFKEVGRHLNFWYSIDYQCPRCWPDRCICTAVEMLLVFDEKDLK
jgi:ribosomal protein S18 acetylase RimI-like enzyme